MKMKHSEIFNFGIILVIISLFSTCEKGSKRVENLSEDGEEVHALNKTSDPNHHLNRNIRQGKRRDNPSEDKIKSRSSINFQPVQDRGAMIETALKSTESIKDPELVDYLSNLPPGEDSGQIISAIIYRLARSDPSKFFSLGQELKESLSHRDYEHVLNHYGRFLGRSGNFDEFQKIESAPWLTDKEKLMIQSSYISELAKKHPDKSIRYLRSLPGSVEKAEIVTYAIENFNALLATNSSDVLDIVNELGELPQSPAAASLLSKMAAAAADHPEKILEYADLIRGSKARRIFVVDAVSEVASKDLNRGLQYLSNISDPLTRRDIIVRLLPKIEEYDPQTAELWRNEMKLKK